MPRRDVKKNIYFSHNILFILKTRVSVCFFSNGTINESNLCRKIEDITGGWLFSPVFVPIDQLVVVIKLDVL